jgi:hypothetical protein
MRLRCEKWSAIDKMVLIFLSLRDRVKMARPTLGYFHKPACTSCALCSLLAPDTATIKPVIATQPRLFEPFVSFCFVEAICNKHHYSVFVLFGTSKTGSPRRILSKSSNTITTPAIISILAGWPDKGGISQMSCINSSRDNLVSSLVAGSRLRSAQQHFGCVGSQSPLSTTRPSLIGAICVETDGISPLAYVSW